MFWCSWNATVVLAEFNHYETTKVDGVSCIHKIIKGASYDLVVKIYGNELGDKVSRYM